MPITLQELADLCSAEITCGDASQVIHSAGDIVTAQAGQVTQLTNSRYQKYLQNSAASACFISASFVVENPPAQLALLVSDDPEMAFIKAVEILHPQKQYSPAIAAQAVISDTATITETAYIGPYAFIGEAARIGENCTIMAGAYIGNNVTLGNNCTIHPYAVIYDDCVLGNNVTIHSGAIIGADGFGYKFRNHQHIKVPQVGNVVLADNVEIGANTCVDRGALGSTQIGAGSKIDNLVQIGHNNNVGKHVIMCGQVGVSGSCTIEDYAILAGSVGVADHLKIGQGAVLMARSGIATDVAAGSQVFGSPAKDKKTAYKEQIAISKLPELLKTIKLMEARIKQLEIDQASQ